MMAHRRKHRAACPPYASLINLAALVLWYTQAVSGSSEVGDLNKKPYDTNADWESTVVARGPGGCTFAKKPTFRPPPTCPPPQTPINRTVASRLGWKFAPILYQHPLDSSWLTDPPHWLDLAAAYDIVGWKRLPNNSILVPPGVESNGAEDEYFSSQQWFATRLTTPVYNATDRKVTFDTVDGAEVLRRAVVDPVVDGRLTGRVHYTVFRPYDEDTGETIPYAYVYTYMYYYPWNGCSNMAVATQVDGKKQGVEFFMCGEGAHEGDLEHIKVYVCEADMMNSDPASAIRRAQYSQHGWLPDFDCEAGECAFERDEEGTRRLVALAALFSHANWNAETPLFVYTKVEVRFLLNMDGVYIGDRYKKGPVFYPSPNNTLYLPFKAEMSAEQKRGELAWALFPGVWGTTVGWTGGRTLTCFADNFTRLVPCDTRNPAYYITAALTRPKGSDPATVTWTAQESGNTVTGPLWGRTFAFAWETERAAPLYTRADRGGGGGGEQLCPLEAPLRNTVAGTAGFGRISLKQYLAAVTGLVLASAVVACAMILPALLVRGDRQVIREIEEEEEAKQAEMRAKEEGAALVGNSPTSPAETTATANTEPPAVPTPTRGASDGENGGSSGGGSAAASRGACLGVPPAAAATAAAAALPAAAAASAASASAGKSATGRSRLLLLLLSHRAILRAFHASVMQPWFLVIWIFIGVALYICGVVLGALGVHDSVVALNRVVPLSLWDTFHVAVITAFVVFGVLHLAIIITSIWVRPTRTQLCACGPRATRCHLECLNRSWSAHAVLVGLLVMEMNVSMLLFALGLMLWVARYLVTEACVAAVKAVFKEITFLDDVCLDLSSVGLSTKVCGAALTDLCNLWGELNVDYLSFGSMCFIIAQAMFLVLATANYVATRTGYAITTVMVLTQKTEAERAARAAAGGAGGIGVRPGSGGGGGLSFLFGRLSGQGLRSRSRGGPEQTGADSGGGGSGGKADTGTKTAKVAAAEQVGAAAAAAAGSKPLQADGAGADRV